MSAPDSTAREGDLFDWSSRYPGRAGHKARDTAAEAAAEIEDSGRAGILRRQVLALLRAEALTADECAARLEESVLAIRPRVSELNKNFLINDTGDRRPNASGRNAIVWRAA